jgi:hypothetical protein
MNYRRKNAQPGRAETKEINHRWTGTNKIRRPKSEVLFGGGRLASTVSPTK